MRAENEVFGYSTEGRPIKGVILGRGEETYLVFGVIHGNEPLGAPLLERFARHLQSRPSLLEGKRLVVIPVTNPDGLARKSRSNARGVDLNRNFPARNWVRRAGHGGYPASEAETRTLLKIMRQFRPQRVLSVHSPLRCINFDGPARSLADKIARVTGYPLRESIGYPTPGSFGSYAGVDLRIPTITMELGRDRRPESAWSSVRVGLEAFLETRPASLASGRFQGPLARARGQDGVLKDTPAY